MKQTLLSLLMFSTCLSLSAQNGNSCLIADYQFLGDASNSVSTNTDGTNNGAKLVTGVDGVAKSAYSFNGSSDYISVPNHSSLNFTDQIALTGWFNATSIGQNWMNVVNKASDDAYDQFEVTVGPANSPYLYFMLNLDSIGRQVLYIPQTVTTGTWHHFACTYDGEYMTIYYDGEEAASRKVGKHSIVTNSYDMTIGAEKENYFNGFYGAIDNFQIFACPYSFDEDTTCLVADYQFNFDADNSANLFLNGDVYGATLTDGYDGSSNSAYSFDGTDDYISVSSSKLLAFTKEITITGYFNVNQFGSNWSNIINKATDDAQDQFEVTLGKTGDEYLYFMLALANSGRQVVKSTQKLDEDQWYEFHCVYNGEYLRIYIDEQLAGESYVGSHSIVPNNNTMTIGAEKEHTYFNGLNGAIDNLKIYKCAVEPKITSIAQSVIPATLGYNQSENSLWLTEKFSTSTQIKVSSLTGASVALMNLPPGQNSVALPKLSHGIYLVQFTGDKGLQVGKLFIP